MLQIGSKIVAQRTEKLIDHVTEGKVYEIVDEFEGHGFIINDLDDKCVPLVSRFALLES